MKAIVTGGCGNLGIYVVRALAAEGAEVTVFDTLAKEGTRENRGLLETLPSVTVLTADCLRVYDYGGDVDVIFHLAGDCSAVRSLKSPARSFQLNAMMTCQVLAAASLYGTPVVYTSSVRAYPNEAGQRTVYGLGKWVGDLLCTEFALSYGVPTISNRFGAMYGVHQHGTDQSGWLSWFVRATVKQMRLVVDGGGLQKRDCLHNRDATDLLLRQAKWLIRTRDTTGRVYDVGGGEDNFVAILSVLHYLRDEHGYSLDHVVQGPARHADVEGRAASNNEVRWDFYWSPITTVWDGIDELVEAARGDDDG